jgi:hypothetical protein
MILLRAILCCENLINFKDNSSFTLGRDIVGGEGKDKQMVPMP